MIILDIQFIPITAEKDNKKPASNKYKGQMHNKIEPDKDIELNPSFFAPIACKNNEHDAIINALTTETENPQIHA